MVRDSFEEIIGVKTPIVKNKSIALAVIKIIIAAGLLIFIISLVDLNEIIETSQGANKYLIALVFGLSFLNIYLQYSKWKLTCGHLLNENNKKKIIISLLQGFSAGAFTPVRLGEFFARGIALNKNSVSQVVIASIFEKLFPLIPVIFFGSISGIFFLYNFYGISVSMVYSLLILEIIIFTVLFHFFSRKSWDNFLMKFKSFKIFSRFSDKIILLKNLDGNYFLKMGIISISFYFCYIIQFALLISAFSNELDFIKYVSAAILIIFIKTFFPPISLGDLGVREGASIFVLAKLGEANAVGFNASFFLFLINILFPAIIGLFLLLKRDAN